MIPSGASTQDRNSRKLPRRVTPSNIGEPIDTTDRLTRLEDALIDLAVVMSEGYLDHRASANMSPVVVEAGGQLQACHWAVIDERDL